VADELKASESVFDRENAVGFLLLAVCAGVGAVLLYAIVTGNQLRYTGPAWLGWLLAAIFLGGILYGLFSGGRFRRGRQWPDPLTGRRPWWQFWRRDDT
jgi:hypothetical protein